MLEREAIIRKCNPELNKADIMSPLTVGNGNFAFTADVTGLQTLYEDYLEGCPLLTQSNWGWHTTPGENGEKYTLSDVKMTEYEADGRCLKYPVGCFDGNEEIYNWLRKNPHRMNLMRLGLWYAGKPVKKENISNISQTLDMFTGVLSSEFELFGKKVSVTTLVAKSDTLAVRIDSKLVREGLGVRLSFPYGTPDISGSDFLKPERHSSEFITDGLIERKIDDFKYYVLFEGNASVEKAELHNFNIFKNTVSGNVLSFTLSLSTDRLLSGLKFRQALEESRKRFYRFWIAGAFVDVTKSKDARAWELQRRIVCSMYLTFVQDSGFLPPQETGLTCNSWYGKFHLEMHPLHTAYLALYGRGALLERSLGWYESIINGAKENAARNGYKGARWPKMVGPEGIDSPSVIAPLLIWQQPHIIYMLELIKESRYRDARVEVPDNETRQQFLQKYRDVVYETARFMEDFVRYNSEKDIYELLPPIIPVQENHAPMDVKNPAFETAYWSFGLRKAYEWLKEIGEEYPNWLEISEKMAPANVTNGVIEAHDNCTETYIKFNHDHPSMLFAYGWISADYDRQVVINSLEKVRKDWDLQSMWGWDFAMLALCYAKLGMMDEAFEMLLWKTDKNAYMANGNNAQLSRKDLPLYLPGNGSLLLAVSALSGTGKWYVETEGIMKYPF